MDARRWQSPAAAAAAAEAAEEDWGASGPSRRPPRRGLHRASPYGLGPRRWLPSLPLASRIFPTVPRDHAAQENNQMDQSLSLEVAHQNQSKESNVNAVPTPVNNNKVNLLLEGEYRNRNDDVGFAEIEKIIKQNNFSMDETEHLIDIIRSRTPDLSNEDQRAPRSFSQGFEAKLFSGKLSTSEKPVDLQSALGTGAPLPNMHDVGSSPIELAKAYMEAQNSVSVQTSQKRKFRALRHGVEVENSYSKFPPKIAVNSPVCWPGSVVRDYPNYLTPQSKKGTLPPTSSRTPYTGSVFPRSIKHTGHRDAYNNSFAQTQVSTPFESKAILEDRMASSGGVQPSTSSKGAYLGVTAPFFPGSSAASTKNLKFSTEEHHGKGTIGSGSTVGCSSVENLSKCFAVSVHPKSSQTALKILQHLDRTIPSPTTKPVVLRQTLAKRTAPFVSNNQNKMPESVNGIRHGQSSMDGIRNAHQEISDAKEVQAPPSSSNAEDSTPKIQNSGSNMDVTEMASSQHPLNDLPPMSAVEALDKSKNNGFTFTFPVTSTSSSLLELPPTPTLNSPPARSLPADSEDIPKYTFSSSSSTNNLVFPGSASSTDEMTPTYKFGSDKKRELSFNIAGKDAVCF